MTFATLGIFFATAPSSSRERGAAPEVMNLRLDKSYFSTSGCFAKNSINGGTRGALVTCSRKERKLE